MVMCWPRSAEERRSDGLEKMARSSMRSPRVRVRVRVRARIRVRVRVSGRGRGRGRVRVRVRVTGEQLRLLGDHRLQGEAVDEGDAVRAVEPLKREHLARARVGVRVRVLGFG